MYYESDDLLELEKTMNLELKKLSLWLNVNRLALNIGKTNFIIFRGRRKPCDHNVTLLMNKKAIEQKNYVKYLGVFIDEHLTWKEHISNISKKISRGVGIVCNLRKSMCTSLLRTIYYSLVYSHIVYGVHVWGSAYSTESDKILILEKKAVRAMAGERWYQRHGEPGPLASSDPLFKQLQVLKLADVYILNVAKFIFSCLSHLTHPMFWDWFTINTDVHDHATTSNTTIEQNGYFDVGIVKQNLTLHRKGCKKESYGAKMIRVLGPVLWNDLPGGLRDSDSIQIFGKNLFKHLLGKYSS